MSQHTVIVVTLSCWQVSQVSVLLVVISEMLTHNIPTGSWEEDGECTALGQMSGQGESP